MILVFLFVNREIIPMLNLLYCTLSIGQLVINIFECFITAAIQHGLHLNLSICADDSTDLSSALPSAITSVGADTTQCPTLLESTASCQVGPTVAMTTGSAPTMILPFLYLGSQNDALSKEFITVTIILTLNYLSILITSITRSRARLVL